MKYIVKVPPTAEVGSYTTTVSTGGRESYRAKALWDYNSCRGLTRGAVSSARARHAEGVKPHSRKPGKRQAEQMQAAVHAEERKTVHEWLNKLGTPTHEKTGLPMCLLRRLAVQLGIQPWEAPAPEAGQTGNFLN